MNRHRAYYPLDDAPVPDGDMGWSGVDMRLNPGALAAGVAASARNLRFDEGRAATRMGIRICTFATRQVDPAHPELVFPFPDVVVAAEFSDPESGDQWTVIVTENQTYAVRAGQTAAVVPHPTGQSLAVATDIFQAYDGLILLRGDAAEPLYLETLAEGWKALPAAEGGKVAMPKATRGLYFANRAVVVDARSGLEYRDSLWVSDIGNVGSVLQGDAAYQQFKINQGSADPLVGVVKWNDSTVVAAKERSIYVVSNIYGTNSEIAAGARLDEVTRAYGCIAPGSFVQVGRDLWFLGHRRGVCSLQQAASGAVQGVDAPVSRDIQPLVDRINWEAASGCVAAVHENRVYFAVPIDGAESNNAVLVYSLLTQRWAGYDQSAATTVKAWIKLAYGGAVRLAFVSTAGFLCLYEDGYNDQTGDAAGALSSAQIETVLETRGYGAGNQGVKRFARLQASVRGVNPSFTIEVKPDGVGEARAALSETWDRTKYRRPYGAADWDDSNAAGDWDTPHREDYSVVPDGLQVTESGTGAGTVAFRVFQDTVIERNLRDRGAYLQIKVTNSRGVLEVSSLSVDALRGSPRDGEQT